ncbi:MAG: photosynthetic reaction center subunit H [Burkholderiales bacterium]
MQTGAITQYIDVAQIALYGFWVFFACLVYYLRREDKREGYPLESDRSASVTVEGWPKMPDPKTFLLRDGSTRVVPRAASHREIAATPSAGFPGAPLEPTGNPMIDGVGPASYALREEVPDMTLDGRPKIVPMAVASDFHVGPGDPDPRGMTVIGADGEAAGVVKELWVDRTEVIIRYLEVEIPSGRRVLLPFFFSTYDVAKRRVRVASILASQFADVPAIAKTDSITFREEDRIMAYFGSGHLYAKPSRLGPLV